MVNFLVISSTFKFCNACFVLYILILQETVKQILGFLVNGYSNLKLNFNLMLTNINIYLFYLYSNASSYIPKNFPFLFN